MEIYSLLKELQESMLCTVVSANTSLSDQMVTNFHLCETSKAVYSENTLYVFNDRSMIPTDNKMLNILLLEDKKSYTQSELSIAGNFIVIDLTDTYATFINFLSQMFNEDEHLNRMSIPIMNAFLRNKGLQKISDIAAQTLGNPFWILDINFNYLTFPKGAVSDNQIQKEMNIGYVLDQTVLSLRENQTLNKVKEEYEPLIFKTPQNNRTVIMQEVKIKNVTVAYVNALEENKLFDTFTQKFIEFISQIVSNELQKNSHKKNNKGLLYSYFLSDLLDGGLNKINYENRLNVLGFKIKKYFYILTVSTKNSENIDLGLNFINEQVKYIFHDSIYCLYKNNIVFLITTETEIRKDSSAYVRFELFLNSSNLIAGLSDKFPKLLSSPSYFQKTITALQLGQRYKSDENLYHYSDLALYDLLDHAHSYMNYSDFCNGAVAALVKSDSSFNTLYIETLHSYLENGSNITNTAKQLNIHQNTLRYRIEKIKELTGCSLNNGNDALELFLSLKMFLSSSTGKGQL